MKLTSICFILLCLAGWLRSGAALGLAASGSAQTYYCAGVTDLQAQRDSRVSVSAQTNTLFVGGIGGVQLYDPASFAQKSSITFPRTARFQFYDELRDWIWMMTAQGAASIDLEDKSATIVSSTLQLNGQNCPLDSTYLNELDGVVYSICVNGTSFAHVIKVNVADRTASISASLPIVELAIDEHLYIASMSPDRRHSMIYLVHVDSQGLIAALYAIHSDPGASGALSILSGYSGNDISRIRYWAGADLDFVYTLEGDSSVVSLVKRNPKTFQVAASSSLKFNASNVISAQTDMGSNQVVVITQRGLYSIQTNGNLNATSFECAKLPTKDSCGNWKISGNSVILGGSLFFSGSCQTQQSTLNLVTRILLSTNDGCPAHCSGHGACFNSSCLCFDKYAGKDCSQSPNANGCGKECTQNSDCWVDPPWNPCPVCVKGKCSTVCTAPCEKSAQCREWASHSVLSQQCLSCNRLYKYCSVDTMGCGAQCANSNGCMDEECPRCTVNGVWPTGKCVH